MVPYWYALNPALHLKGNYDEELDATGHRRRHLNRARGGTPRPCPRGPGNIAGIDSALAVERAPSLYVLAQGAMLVTAARSRAHAGGVARRRIPSVPASGWETLARNPTSPPPLLDGLRVRQGERRHVFDHWRGFLRIGVRRPRPHRARPDNKRARRNCGDPPQYERGGTVVRARPAAIRAPARRHRPRSGR